MLHGLNIPKFHHQADLLLCRRGRTRALWTGWKAFIIVQWFIWQPVRLPWIQFHVAFHAHTMRHPWTDLKTGQKPISDQPAEPGRSLVGDSDCVVFGCPPGILYTGRRPMSVLPLENPELHSEMVGIRYSLIIRVGAHLVHHLSSQIHKWWTRCEPSFKKVTIFENVWFSNQKTGFQMYNQYLILKIHNIQLFQTKMHVSKNCILDKY